LWFTNEANSSIGRITTTGAVQQFTDPSIVEPSTIVAGPDGAMWFTDDSFPLSAKPTGDSIGRITTSGQVSHYSDPTIDGPSGIAVGPDRALWFTNYQGGSIGRITTSGRVTNYTDPSIFGPTGIVAGPDGALWFTNGGNNVPLDSIGRITTSGTVSHFTDPSLNMPAGITVGPDGALWFTNELGGGSIGRITTAGQVSHYSDPTIVGPHGITVGADGAVWFTNGGNPGSIGRITTSGQVTTFTDPSIFMPTGITAGPDGALWFTDTGFDTIDRLAPPPPPRLVVVAGPDRDATAVQASQVAFPTPGSAGVVVLARNDLFADALAGSRLATAKGGPLLLTPSASLDPQTAAEVRRVLPPGGLVYVLGGPAAIDPSIDSQLQAQGFTTVREAGATRFETAAAVAEADEQPDGASPSPPDGPIFLATGLDFPDGLVAGAAASAVGGVVLLSDGSQPDPTTSAFIQGRPGATLYAVGGQAASAYPGATPLSGATRYGTATSVAARFFTAPNAIGVATGAAFPDALSGGAAIGHLGGPLLLTDPQGVAPSTQQYLAANATGNEADYVFGGDAAVPPAVRDEIAAAQA
jgi:streptogramin lyase